MEYGRIARTSGIADVVDATEFRYGGGDQSGDGGFVGYVCDGDFHGGGAVGFVDESCGLGEAGLVAVGEDDLGAAFAGEGYGGGLADTWE